MCPIHIPGSPLPAQVVPRKKVAPSAGLPWVPFLTSFFFVHCRAVGARVRSHAQTGTRSNRLRNGSVVMEASGRPWRHIFPLGPALCARVDTIDNKAFIRVSMLDRFGLFSRCQKCGVHWRDMRSRGRRTRGRYTCVRSFCLCFCCSYTVVLFFFHPFVSFYFFLFPPSFRLCLLLARCWLLLVLHAPTASVTRFTPTAEAARHGATHSSFTLTHSNIRFLLLGRCRPRLRFPSNRHRTSMSRLFYPPVFILAIPTENGKIRPKEPSRSHHNPDSARHNGFSLARRCGEPVWS